MVEIVSRNLKKESSTYSDVHNNFGALINDEKQLFTSRVTRSQKWKKSESKQLSNSSLTLTSHAVNDVEDVGGKNLKKRVRISKAVHKTDIDSNIISIDAALSPSTSKQIKFKSLKLVDNEHQLSNQRVTRSQKALKIESNPSVEKKVNSIREHRVAERVLRSSRQNTDETPMVPKSVHKPCKEIQKRESIKMHQCEHVQDGQIVLIKWPSYPYWPGIIKGITNTLVDVEFFGDNRLAFIF